LALRKRCGEYVEVPGQKLDDVATAARWLPTPDPASNQFFRPEGIT
jgi:hypothetical protein